MTDKEKKIMETCGKMLPRLSENEKENFLIFTEGMAFLSDYRARTDTGQREARPSA